MSDYAIDIANIYTHYKEVISDLIAYIEVYEHDLPGNIMAQIAEFFQDIAVYETSDTDKILLSNSIQSTKNMVSQSLYKYTISLCINRIYKHKKRFKRYNYKGVMIRDDSKNKERNFYIIANERQNNLLSKFNKCLKDCYKGKVIKSIVNMSFKESILFLLGYIKFQLMPCSLIKFKRDIFIPHELLIKVDMKKIFESAISLLELYQNNYSRVISNGARTPFLRSVFFAIVSWIIPILLAIYPVMKIIDFIKK